MTLGPELILAKELGISCIAIGVGHVDTEDGFNKIGVEESLLKSSKITFDIINNISNNLDKISQRFIS